MSLKELVCGLKERHRVMPRVIAFGDGPLRTEYEESRIPIQVLPSFRDRCSTVPRLNTEVNRLARLICASPADVVFANTLPNFPVVLAAEVAGVPTVWNVRESEPWDSYFRYLPDPVAEQAIASIGLPASVVFVAESTRAVWSDFDREANFKVIHNSVALDRFPELINDDKVNQRESLGWSRDEVVILSVGTLCERKGQRDALLALENIVDRLKTRVRVVFVGNADSRYGWLLRIFALRFSRNGQVHINFEAPTAFVARYFIAADAFLLCSRTESYPRVILEALAFGLPIISTRVFGVAEQLPNPTDALFYSPGDIPQLSAQMLEVVNSSMVRQSLGERSRARFAEMESFEQMLKAYDDVLRNAIKFGS